MEQKNKEYVGRRVVERMVQSSNGEFKVINISFNQQDLDLMQAKALENNGWVNLSLTKKQAEPTEKNPSTHKIAIDAWKPKAK